MNNIEVEKSEKLIRKKGQVLLLKREKHTSLGDKPIFFLKVKFITH